MDKKHSPQFRFKLYACSFSNSSLVSTRSPRVPIMFNCTRRSFTSQSVVLEKDGLIGEGVQGGTQDTENRTDKDTKGKTAESVGAHGTSVARYGGGCFARICSHHIEVGDFAHWRLEIPPALLNRNRTQSCLAGIPIIELSS
jgi:hypothetical protein